MRSSFAAPVLAAAAAIGLASAAAAQTPPAVELSLVTDGLVAPVGIASADDGSGRLFVVEQAGTVRIWDGAQLVSESFLDIRDRVLAGGERGLFAIAFHPDFAQNGLVYASYTRDGVLVADDGDNVLSRFAIDPQDPDRLDETSEAVLLVIDQPEPNHNGGDLHFGPDGYLYLSLGDGGGAGDPSENAQDTSNLLGTILRLDVDGAFPYESPATNPFVGDPDGRDEIWAYGLRSPWKFSFDREMNDLFIGDVGQGAQEEIAFEPAASLGGLNFGWDVVEGDLCFEPPSGCETAGLTPPILTYDHVPMTCEAVTGGFRHRGSRSTALGGWYFFAEGCPRGRLFAANDTSGSWSAEVVLELGSAITAFGEDEQGELYLVDYGAGELLLVPEPCAPPLAGAALAALAALTRRRLARRARPRDRAAGSTPGRGPRASSAAGTRARGGA